MSAEVGGDRQSIEGSPIEMGINPSEVPALGLPEGTPAGYYSKLEAASAARIRLEDAAQAALERTHSQDLSGTQEPGFLESQPEPAPIPQRPMSHRKPGQLRQQASKIFGKNNDSSRAIPVESSSLTAVGDVPKPASEFDRQVWQPRPTPDRGSAEPIPAAEQSSSPVGAGDTPEAQNNRTTINQITEAEEALRAPGVDKQSEDLMSEALFAEAVKDTHRIWDEKLADQDKVSVDTQPFGVQTVTNETEVAPDKPVPPATSTADVFVPNADFEDQPAPKVDEPASSLAPDKPFAAAPVDSPSTSAPTPSMDQPAPSSPDTQEVARSTDAPNPSPPDVGQSEGEPHDDFKQLREVVEDGYSAKELEDELRRRRAERAAQFASPETTAPAEQAGLETPATYGARLNAEGLWELSPRDEVLGKDDNGRDTFRVSTARQMIEAFNNAITAEGNIDAKLVNSKIDMQEQLSEQAINAQKSEREKLLAASDADLDVARTVEEIAKKRGTLLKHQANANDESKTAGVRSGAKTRAENLTKQIATDEASLLSKQAEAEKLRQEAAEQNALYQESDAASKEFAATTGERYTTFIAEERARLLEEVEDLRTAGRKSASDSTADEIKRTEGEDPKDESQGTRIVDPEVAQAVANAEKFTYEQMRSFQAQRNEALRLNPDGELNHIARQRNEQIEGLRAKIDGIHGNPGISKIAETQALSERAQAKEKYTTDYEKYTELISSILAQDGSAKLGQPITGEMPQALKLVEDVMKNLGVDPASEDHTEVILRTGFFKPKYIDRYVLKDGSESDASKRGIAMVARTDYETGKLIRFDIVKEPLKFNASARETAAWRRRVDASLEAGRVLQPNFNKIPEPSSDNVKLKSKSRYAQMMRGYGMPAERAQSSANSGKVKSSFWARFWGW